MVVMGRVLGGCGCWEVRILLIRGAKRGSRRELFGLLGQVLVGASRSGERRVFVKGDASLQEWGRCWQSRPSSIFHLLPLTSFGVCGRFPGLPVQVCCRYLIIFYLLGSVLVLPSAQALPHIIISLHLFLTLPIPRFLAPPSRPSHEVHSSRWTLLRTSG